MSDAHQFATDLSYMVEAIEHSRRIDAHPLKKGHHAGVVGQRISGVDANGIAKTNWLMMSDSIADIVDEVEFVEDVVVVVLDLGR